MLPLSFIDITFSYSTLALFLNSFHQHIILVATVFCTPSQELKTSPIHPNFFFGTSPSIVTSSSTLFPVNPDQALYSRAPFIHPTVIFDP